MKVAARFYGYLKEAAGGGELEFELPDGSVLESMVEYLRERGASIRKLLSPDERGLVPVAIVVNGRICPKAEWAKTPLQDGVVVQFLPPTMGGSGS